MHGHMNGKISIRKYVTITEELRSTAVYRAVSFSAWFQAFATKLMRNELFWVIRQRVVVIVLPTFRDNRSVSSLGGLEFLHPWRWVG